MTNTGGRLPIGLAGSEEGGGRVVLSARAIGGGVGAGTAADTMDLGWVGTSFGVVSGRGQGGANAFKPEMDPDPDFDWERDFGAMIDGRRQSSSAGDPAMMVASLEVEDDRDRD